MKKIIFTIPAQADVRRIDREAAMNIPTPSAKIRRARLSAAFFMVVQAKGELG